MPADFLNPEQRAGYGRFSADPNDVQLARFFCWMKQIWCSLTTAAAGQTSWRWRC
ncbi:DUF4158 domain-containing protein [Xylella fastidiosa]|uniref:DUF4158 domain-containing protein n=1 Tax=Xylella fastidiosa TaxID=2371 RepID=UPI0002E149D5|nr:DUF4158 domain-containing protein [Xylella fastidiosa]UIX82625.1 DUF4158 domain-containing protein [Xylella fastidiosa subsp. sandyi]